MDSNHIILAVAWTVYCVLHSVLASIRVKARAQKWLGNAYRYYRFAYTIFSFLGLVALLVYQVQLDSPLLFETPLAVQFAASLLGGLGAALVMLNIFKYFMQLSGVRWLVSSTVNAKLEQKGLHRYVRHPLYFSTFLFIWCLWVVYPYLSLLIANTIITIYTLIGISFEEQKLLKEFGQEYEEYRKRVPKIVPFVKRRLN
jgi:methanethiol S-methyltransferase